MSVLTEIKKNDINNFLAHYSLGSLTQFSAITEGTVNSNYLVSIESKKYILSLFEYLNQNEAEQYLHLTEYLHQEKLPCANPIKTNQQQYTQSLKTKPASLVEFLEGKSIAAPLSTHCRQIADFIGKMHLKTSSFPLKIKNVMDHHWLAKQCQAWLQKCLPDERHLLTAALEIEAQIPWDKLPKSIIHFDLFRDNAVFQNGQLSGVFDFYYACYDIMLLDIAISLNDWCTDWQDPTLPLKADWVALFMEAYENTRPLQEIEKQFLLPIVQLMSAHFWITRLNSQISPPSGLAITLKSPDEFKRILSNRLLLQAL